MDTSAETLHETYPLCKKDFGEGNTSNICKLLKKEADKVNEASHKRGRDDVVVAERLTVHRDCRKWCTNERDTHTALKLQN